VSVRVCVSVLGTPTSTAKADVPIEAPNGMWIRRGSKKPLMHINATFANMIVLVPTAGSLGANHYKGNGIVLGSQLCGVVVD